MPLPREGAPWPPEGGSKMHEELRENAAWYSGDPDRLGLFYGPRNGVAPRPAQFSGGVVGTLARWWWGTPAAEGEQNAKLHVPLAADIASTSADLLFSESVGLKSDAQPVAEYLSNVQADGLDSRLHEGAEVCAALGAVYLRVQWDTTVRARPWTTVVHPDGAIPEFRAGLLQAVNLWTALAELRHGEVYRHVERHEPGAILHRLYKGTADNLGRVVPLQDHPATEHLAALVNAEGAQPTGTRRLTVSHVPNMLPDRRFRHSMVGRSDFQGVTPLFDALDEAYSSWWRDIRHGKSRIHVPAQYLDSDGPGQGARANLDRELYVPLQGVLANAATSVKDNIVAQQFVIRVAEHSQTCKEWRETAIESAGYSTQSLSSEAGAMTATEVHAKNRRSYMTRGKKIRYWTAGLRDHLGALLEVANANLSAGLGSDLDVHVDFQDGVQESAMEVSQTAQALKNAQAASTETLVRMVHEDWSEDDVRAEVAKIMAEVGTPVPDPLPGDAGL